MMVKTRQEVRTDPSPARGSDQSLHYKSDPDWDPLVNTSSHVPTTLVHSEGDKLMRLQDDLVSRQKEVSMPKVSNRHKGDHVSPLVASTAAPNPFSDPAFMDHIMRVVVAEMRGSHYSAVGEGYARDGLYDLPW